MNLGLCLAREKKKQKTKARIDATMLSTGSQTLADDLPRRKHTPDVQTHACETWRGAVRVIQRVRLSQLRVIHKPCLLSRRGMEEGWRKGRGTGASSACQIAASGSCGGSARYRPALCLAHSRRRRTRSHTPPRLSRNEDRVRSASESQRGINPAQLS